jgi:hypothetical protein
MVEQFRQSGLTRRAFSQQSGVPLATLSWWLRKTRKVANLPAPMPILFREINLRTPEISSPHAWAMEVIAPSGMTVRFREPLAVKDLVKLMRGGRC